MLKVQGLEFEIHLTRSYPLTAPRVLCTSNTTFPSISDGCDLLSHILAWDPTFTSLNIIEALPIFLETHQLSGEFGDFQLLSIIPLEIWDQKDSMIWFYCTEIDPCNKQLRKNRIIVVTHTHFLMMDPVWKQSAGVLVFWANLYSISALSRSKKEQNEVLVEWRSQAELGFQVFETKQSRKFVELVSENLKKLGSIAQGNFLIQIEENQDKYKIYEILRKIEKTERLLETIVDDEKIYSLIALYQKAIEHFSAENDPQYEVYISKLHEFLNDVRVLKQIFSGTQKSTVNRNRVRSYEGKKKVIEEPEVSTIRTRRDSL